MKKEVGQGLHIWQYLWRLAVCRTQHWLWWDGTEEAIERLSVFPLCSASRKKLRNLVNHSNVSE